MTILTAITIGSNYPHNIIITSATDESKTKWGGIMYLMREGKVHTTLLTSTVSYDTSEEAEKHLHQVAEWCKKEHNIEEGMVDEFNRKHPVGSEIQYKHEDGTIKTGKIRAAAELFRGADHVKFSYENPTETKQKEPVACVYIEKRYDAVHLKDVVK